MSIRGHESRKRKWYVLFPDLDPGFEFLSQQVSLSRRSGGDMPVGIMKAPFTSQESDEFGHIQKMEGRVDVGKTSILGFPQ